LWLATMHMVFASAHLGAALFYLRLAEQQKYRQMTIEEAVREAEEAMQ
jgi:hypothetical protein